MLDEFKKKFNMEVTKENLFHQTIDVDVVKLSFQRVVS